MIADPQFYIWATAAVLLVGLAKSGFLSGFGAAATPLIKGPRKGALGGLLPPSWRFPLVRGVYLPEQAP
ncbi:MAG: hypothetical protein FJY26_04285 [Betaproteobacteria bacterium]|nr:hypothetical protein [Betaproteobacteria bacterium]